MIAETYYVYCRDLHIGVLDIDEQGRHRYTVRREETDYLNSFLPLYVILVQGQPEFGPPDFGLKSKIYNMKRFGFTEYTFMSDGICLRRVFPADGEAET